MKKIPASKSKRAVASKSPTDVHRTGKRIDAIRHAGERRLLIPSQEEAGLESDNPVVTGKRRADFPLNPVTTRGQDPELFWMHKYGPSDDQERLSVDIRSLYRHEHVEPETLIHRLYKISKNENSQNDLFINETFGNLLGAVDELDKPKKYYKHAQDWRNRLIQGDSLLVMSSLLEREGLAGKVQMIYIDPPYGIKYGSNWQMRANSRVMSETDADSSLSGEPEVVKAFRDTWELGVHSYLSYLRDRLIVSRELLTESGSCFVQISDTNVHLVRCVLDEVFGSDNFISQISFQTTSGFATKTIATLGDYLLWYAKNKPSVRVRKLYEPQAPVLGEGNARWILLPDGSYRGVTAAERKGEKKLPDGARLYSPGDMQSQGAAKEDQTWIYQGKPYKPLEDSHWKANFPLGLERLAAAGRIHVAKNSIRYRRFHDDFPYQEMGNIWTDTISGSFTDEKVYVVQTNSKVIERCVLLATDPGDLVLDPTCGSGTTAYAAEKWGRRWITSDTSRIAMGIAKERLLTATYDWFVLHDASGEDIRHGFEYPTVQHVMLENIANDEPPAMEPLRHTPRVDDKKLRVTGPFTVETLQSSDVLAPDDVEMGRAEAHDLQRFVDRVFAHLQSAGIKNGIRNENAVFTRINALAHEALHAEGFYITQRGEAKAYIHIGPQFGTVSKQVVNEAAKECRIRGDADWLVILGFRFDDDIETREVSTKHGSFILTKVRMHDDLLQEGLIKKDKKAASFVTIGEPDIYQEKQKDGSWVIEIQGLDIYDPIHDELKPRSAADIAYWMVDDDYDGSSFIVRQIFFCGGDKDEFDKWRRGLSDLAKQITKRKVEQTLKVEIDDEAFDRLYGFRSHPIPGRKGRRVAVRVVSQFGEESTKVLTLGWLLQG